MAKSGSRYDGDTRDYLIAGSIALIFVLAGFLIRSVPPEGSVVVQGQVVAAERSGKAGEYRPVVEFREVDTGQTRRVEARGLKSKAQIANQVDNGSTREVFYPPGNPDGAKVVENTRVAILLIIFGGGVAMMCLRGLLLPLIRSSERSEELKARSEERRATSAQHSGRAFHTVARDIADRRSNSLNPVNRAVERYADGVVMQSQAWIGFDETRKQDLVLWPGRRPPTIHRIGFIRSAVLMSLGFGIWVIATGTLIRTDLNFWALATTGLGLMMRSGYEIMVASGHRQRGKELMAASKLDRESALQIYGVRLGRSGENSQPNAIVVAMRDDELWAEERATPQDEIRGGDLTIVGSEAEFNAQKERNIGLAVLFSAMKATRAARPQDRTV